MPLSIKGVWSAGPVSDRAVDVNCLRCPNVRLDVLQSDPRIAFFRCPSCQRQFSQQPGGPLVERWLGALSLVLYGVIFEEEPVNAAARVAGTLKAQKTPEQIGRIVREIRLELEHPTQPVRHILPDAYQDRPNRERDLREFLTKLADSLST